MTAAGTQDALNQGTWSTASAQQDLLRGAKFTDPGERAAFEHLLERVRSRPILDLGVGTGRTIGLLKPLTSDYRGLDYVPAMVEISRRNHPDANVVVGDARTLAEYPSGHFALVNFSFNGIDAVSATDRRKVLRAVRRVLAADGVFFFSTLNIKGPSYRERPWKIRVWGTRHPVRYAKAVVRQLAGAPRDLINWMEIRRRSEHGPGYAVAPLSAHHYGVLAHYTTLERQIRELADEGFAAPLVFESVRGNPVKPGDDTSRVDWFHLLAEKAR